MSRTGWYMFAYDIADPKRLLKVHRVMKQAGLAAQKSVFFVQGNESEIVGLLNRLEKIIKHSKDDIRAYPVTHPSQVWTTGGPLETFPLVRGGQRSSSKKQQSKDSKSVLKKILKKFSA